MEEYSVALGIYDIRDARLLTKLKGAVGCTTERLFVHFVECEKFPILELFSILANVFGVAAFENPTLDLIPLLPSAGWSTDRVLDVNIEAVYVCEEADKFRVPTKLWAKMKLVDISDKELEVCECDRTLVYVESDNYEYPRYDRVAVGGTFDKLHAGHRLLLSITSLIAKKFVFAGITGQLLLQNKAFSMFLDPYESRAEAVECYVKRVNPKLTVQTGPLLNPDEPTLAAVDPSIQALVVSQETLPGGREINRDRVRRGFPPLALVIINILGGVEKLSSTDLRRELAISHAPPYPDFPSSGSEGSGGGGGHDGYDSASDSAPPTEGGRYDDGGDGNSVSEGEEADNVISGEDEYVGGNPPTSQDLEEMKRLGGPLHLQYQYAAAAAAQRRGGAEYTEIKTGLGPKLSLLRGAVDPEVMKKVVTSDEQKDESSTSKSPKPIEIPKTSFSENPKKAKPRRVEVVRSNSNHD